MVAFPGLNWYNTVISVLEVIGLKKLFPQLETTSFLKKLFVSLLALVMASIILATSFLLTSYYHSASKLTDRFFANLLLQSNYSITYMNDLAERLSSSLAYNQHVITFLNMDEPDSLQAVTTKKAVNSIVLPLTYVDSVYLYNKNLDLILDTKTGTQSDLESFYDKAVARQLSGYDGLQGSAYTPFVHDSVYYGQISALYSYIIPDHDREGNMTSACIINIRMDVLMNSLRDINANNEYVKFVVASPDGKLLSGSPFEDPQDTAQLQELVVSVAGSGRSADSRSAVIGSQKYEIAYTNNNSNGWFIFGLVPFSYIFRDVITNTLVCLLFVSLLSGACVLVSRKLAQRLNRPVEVITQIAKGESLSASELDALEAQEFQYLATVMNQMQDEKEEYAQYVHRTKDLVRKEFLKNFFSGVTVYTPEQVRPRLEDLNCAWILEDPLRMCLFSIDNYADFAQNNNPRERWALRFAVINVATELLQKHFDCEMVQSASNQFIAILNCSDQEGADRSVSTLESVLNEILSFIHTNLGFTLTAAYGTVFHDISHLPQIYENMEELLLLRIRHGGGRVLNPHMAEDLDLDDFHVSAAVEDALVSNVVNGSAPQASAQFGAIAKDLFRYSYHEVLPYLMHLSYRLFNCVKDAGVSAKAQVAEAFQKVTVRLPQCETESDFRECFTEYLKGLCDIVSSQKGRADAQSSRLIIQRVIRIIETNYPQKELCLSSIADELGMSAHYIGQVFRTSQNKSVAKYIMDLRLEKIAQELRNTSRSFAEIMEDVGLDPEQKNYIYTCFKKCYGVTVKNYRLQAAAQTE